MGVGVADAGGGADAGQAFDPRDLDETHSICHRGGTEKMMG